MDKFYPNVLQVDGWTNSDDCYKRRFLCFSLITFIVRYAVVVAKQVCDLKTSQNTSSEN